MSRRTVALVVLATGCVTAACADREFEPPDRGVRVDRASAAFSPAMFDTVYWSDDERRASEGNDVYATECRRCHGALGEGRTDYARERNLTVPSLVDPDWPRADMDSLRRAIFIGHESGMPIYGDGDLTPREIDATAAYILRTLRPEVLERDR